MGRKHNHFVTSDERKPLDRKLTRSGAFHLVLLNPRIPQNTGAVARLCAATGCKLDLVNPFFKIDDAKLKRAGLDYWPLLDVETFESFEDWASARKDIAWSFIETGSPKLYWEECFQPSQALIFGDEQDGIAPSILSQYSNRVISLPQQNVRSLNLAMCVGIVCFEGLRQLGWRGT